MVYLKKMSQKLDHGAYINGKISDLITIESPGGFPRSFSIDDAHESMKSYLDLLEHIYGVELKIWTENKRKAILKSLVFSQLNERELMIPEAHRRTFAWIFDSSVDFGLADWLRNGSGVFWVAGKAGSGKSSLMRFVTEHETTRELLSQWADNDVTIAKHYFWNPGTPLQKSQEGLLRTLLLHILTKWPELIPVTCEDRWVAPYADRFKPWTHSQLLKALRALKAVEGESSRPKICLFIDGMDEYKGDHVELINTILGLAACSNIKICVSSRPWVDFSDAFGGSPWKLQLQDLTRQDISIYVQDKLEENERFNRLQSNANMAASELIKDVTTRSEGVFLWVYLVVRSLLRGLRNEDDLTVLRQRLEALPGDLNTFFERMLDSIEDIYRQRTARLFLTLSSARSALPVLTFFFLDFDDHQPSADPPDLTFLKDWPDADTRHFEFLISKKRQLVAQCKDIIHIAPDPTAPVLFGERVAFLHRTVVDFINTDKTYGHLKKLASPSFDPLKVLFDASLGQAKTLMHLYHLTYIRNRLSQWILGCFFYAYRIDLTLSSPYEQVNIGLDELEQTILRHFDKWDFSHAMETLLDRDDIESFNDLAARFDLATYVSYRLPQRTVSTLDENAPGWRSPFYVRQDSGFRIDPHPRGGWDWRIGRTFGAKRAVQSLVNPGRDENSKETMLQLPPRPGQRVIIDQDAREKRKRRLLSKILAMFRRKKIIRANGNLGA